MHVDLDQKALQKCRVDTWLGATLTAGVVEKCECACESRVHLYDVMPTLV